MTSQTIKINKNTWEEYVTLLNYLNNEKDKMQGKYIISDDFEEIKNFLES